MRPRLYLKSIYQIGYQSVQEVISVELFYLFILYLEGIPTEMIEISSDNEDDGFIVISDDDEEEDNSDDDDYI